MKREAAIAIMQSLVGVQETLNALCESIETIEDMVERKRFRSAVANLMGDFLEIERPVVRQFPEMDPDPLHLKT